MFTLFGAISLPESTSDLSHWCCVAESLLENQAYAVQRAIERTYHVHARVGSAQSPQVIDSRDGNYTIELDLFTEWWVLMIKNALKNKCPFVTVTPEYGPHPYSLYKANNKIPLVDKWEINNLIKDHLAESVKNMSKITCL